MNTLMEKTQAEVHSTKNNINKILGSLAVLSVNYRDNKDYIDNFLPLIATLINKKRYPTLDNIGVICDDFRDEYGLYIPYHPMISILDRARQKGMIRVNEANRTLVPVYDNIAAEDISIVSGELLQKQMKVKIAFIEFSSQKYNETLSEEDADRTIFSFVKEHSIAIFSRELTDINNISVTKEKEFLFSKFIIESQEGDPEIFKYLVDIATAHVLASTFVFFNEDEYLSISDAKGLKIYLDTRFIIILLGLEGNERKAIFGDFLRNLIDNNVVLCIYRHNLDEVDNIVEDCRIWINNPRYDPTKASRSLRYLYYKGCNAADVIRIAISIPEVLKEYEINTVEGIDLVATDIESERNMLYDVIVEKYKTMSFEFNEEEKRFTILNDVVSILSTKKLRKAKNPRTLFEAQNIFISMNDSLMHSNLIFEKRMGLSGVFPVCLTDLHLGTLLWLQSPTKVVSFNLNKILADCYAAMQPNELLIKKYCNEIERIKNEGRISDNEYFVLRTYQVAINLLQEKTLGDPHRLTTKTTEEIIDEIREQIRREEWEKYQKFVDERNKKEEQRIILMQQREDEFKKEMEEREERYKKILTDVQKDYHNSTRDVQIISEKYTELEKRFNNVKIWIYRGISMVFLGVYIAILLLQYLPSFMMEYPVIKGIALSVLILINVISFNLGIIGKIKKSIFKQKI